MNVARQDGRKAGRQDGTVTRSQQLGLLILLIVFIVYVLIRVQ
jgi:flagellar biogenesis protein FliO